VSSHRQRPIVRDGWGPTWSPDGKQLAFERGPVQAPDVWVVDLATKNERRLVRNGSSPDWSPDGRRIVFYRCTKGEYPCFIHVIRADGTAHRRLFAGREPVWSPNGKEIAFIGKDARHHYHDAIIRARFDGSGRRVVFGVTGYCACGSLDWSPRVRRGSSLGRRREHSTRCQFHDERMGGTRHCANHLLLAAPLCIE
jgi:Tol biopolymer transport system component